MKRRSFLPALLAPAAGVLLPKASGGVGGGEARTTAHNALLDEIATLKARVDHLEAQARTPAPEPVVAPALDEYESGYGWMQAMRFSGGFGSRAAYYPTATWSPMLGEVITIPHFNSLSASQTTPFRSEETPPTNRTILAVEGPSLRPPRKRI